jgi:hypothetical protein
MDTAQGTYDCMKGEKIYIRLKEEHVKAIHSICISVSLGE